MPGFEMKGDRKKIFSRSGVQNLPMPVCWRSLSDEGVLEKSGQKKCPLPGMRMEGVGQRTSAIN
jgi:hypothetical protein